MSAGAESLIDSNYLDLVVLTPVPRSRRCLTDRSGTLPPTGKAADLGRKAVVLLD
jgi:hypothetical protein